MARSEPVIVASGVVLVRETEAGREVCVLHRPRHRDWSLPKGKLEEGEHITAAARRETIEETGCDVVLGPPLTTQHYRADGKPKTVHYWIGRIRPGGPGFAPNREVDRITWLDESAATKRLTYPRDIDLMTAALRARPTSPLIVLRHAQAIRRSRWKKPDDNGRPLAASGNSQAARLIDVLSAFDIRRVTASNAQRCLDTVRPYAKQVTTTVEHEPLLSEIGFEQAPAAALHRMNLLLTDQAPIVVCTHRPVLPELFAHIAKRVGLSPAANELAPSLPPGGFVVLHRTFDDQGRLSITAIDRHVL